MPKSKTKIFCINCKHYKEKLTYFSWGDGEERPIGKPYPYCTKCLDTPIRPNAKEIGEDIFEQNVNNNCPYYEKK